MRSSLYGFVVVLSLSLLAPVAHADFFNCSPAEVGSFGNRVHVRCSSASGSIAFFAMSTTNPAIARFTDLALAALVNNKTLVIQFNPSDLSGPAFGCLSRDCRPALGVLLVK